MELLEAVNTVLPFMGEHPVTRVEGSSHPVVDAIVLAIARKTRLLLAEGWWFNEHTTTLEVETDGRIRAPSNCIAVYGISAKVSIEGGYLYDLGNNTRYFTNSVDVKFIRNIPFTDLPEYAAQYVTYDAGIEVYTSDLGVEESLQVMQATANRSLAQLRQENLRNRDYNVHKRSKPRRYWRLR